MTGPAPLPGDAGVPPPSAPGVLDVKAWIDRLRSEFSFEGKVGGQITSVLQAEQEHRKYVSATFHGQEVLTDAFQGFYFETIQLVAEIARERGWPEKAPYYGPILVQFVCLFRNYRACQISYERGYAMSGYASLRDVKDQACFLAAIAHNVTTFAKVWGIGGTDCTDPAERKKQVHATMAEQSRVLKWAMRSASGLDDAVVEELDGWEGLFHTELHGSRLSQSVATGDWVKHGTFPPLVPTVRENELAHYMCRAAEIGWMLTRLLPYLQPFKNAFGGEWRRRQRLLDDSFRFMQAQLAAMGKPIGEAFTRFVDAKLAFPEPLYYREADGSAGAARRPC